MKIIIAFFALILGASVACAADQKKEGSNKDGDKSGEQEKGEKLGPRDRAKQQEEMFKKMDANSDGKVNKQEFGASQGGEKAPAAAQERFDKMDRNKDGELTKREFTTPVYESAGDRAKREGDKPAEGDKKPGDKK